MKVKTKRKICGYITAFALMLMLGIYGGIERELILLKDGIAPVIICLVVAILAAHKGGWTK